MLDLFSGVGGFSLGLERSGLARTVAFCEIDPFCRKVLTKHWPKVPQYEDIRELTAARLAADGIERPRVICGGFPCQDISVAGRGAGLAGERSGLWREYARLIGELRPELVFVENVAALLGRGLGTVLGDLAALGYDAEWRIISAADVGAPHLRERLWIAAYSQYGRLEVGWGIEDSCSQFDELSGIQGAQLSRLRQQEGEVLADSFGSGQSRQGESLKPRSQAPRIDWKTVDALSGGFGDFWRAEPDVGRVANGVPNRTHRLKALGNAVVPQIPELLGRAVMKAML
jgi:DNA (cytosine-5)-methyltransferase 1